MSCYLINIISSIFTGRDDYFNRAGVMSSFVGFQDLGVFTAQAAALSAYTGSIPGANLPLTLDLSGNTFTGDPSFNKNVF